MSIGRRALIESVIGGLLLALLLTLTKEISFVQALTEPVTIVAAVSAFIPALIIGCTLGSAR